MPDFLTLEGHSPRKRNSPSLSSILNTGESLAAAPAWGSSYAARRAAAEEAAGVARTAAGKIAAEDVQTAEAIRHQGMTKRLADLMKPTEEGQEKSKGLFSMYDLDFDDEEGLGFWKRIRRMTTPPARVRQVFRRVVTPPRTFRRYIPKVKVGSALKKIGRYGFAASTLPLTAFGGGKVRNKLFGLQGKEMKLFDLAAKVGRMATASVVSIAGGPAIMGSMSKLGASGLSKYLASAAGKGFLKNKAMSLVMKDLGGNSVWKIAKDAGGKLVASKLARSTVPAEDYAQLPNNQPIASGPIEPPMPPTVAGSGGMMPGGEDGMPARLGQVSPYDRGAIMKSEMENNPLLFPNVMTQDPESSHSPSETPSALPFDELSTTELIAQAQEQSSQEAGPEVPEQSDLDGDPFTEALKIVQARETSRLNSNGKRVKSRRRNFSLALARCRRRSLEEPC